MDLINDHCKACVYWGGSETRKLDATGCMYTEGKCVHKSNGTAAIKLDESKPPISLLHRDFLEGTAQVMGFGAGKYGVHNWCKGLEHSRLLDACLRHLIAIIDGEDIDPESGLPHRHHACASLNMYCGNVVLHPELDDRYK